MYKHVFQLPELSNHIYIYNNFVSFSSIILFKYAMYKMSHIPDFNTFFIKELLHLIRLSLTKLHGFCPTF